MTTQTQQVIDAEQLTYREAGVDTEGQDKSMPLLRDWVEKSFALRPSYGAVKLPLGYFANVLDIGHGIGLALSTDGVGTKALIAQMMGKYDTIGIDCVAMNVNDIICVGAEPLAILDYIAVEAPHADLLGPIAKGLYHAAELSGVTIPGGEIAQIREMIHGDRDGYAFDIVGTCAGIVPVNNILYGEKVEDGDVVIGLRSSGVHSNGLTLARRVLFDYKGWHIDQHSDELGRTIGEELLEPTHIYVREVMQMMRSGINIKALANITSTGFLNLSRGNAPMGFVIDNLPDPHPVFNLIQSEGGISDEEMFLTYNMGIGFCVVVSPQDVSRILSFASQFGIESQVVGASVSDPDKKIVIPSRRLIGVDGKFVKAD